MQIRVIAATDEDMGIGKDNKIPWHNRSDLQHFARTTIGSGKNGVVMGKNTYISIGKPLRDRVNIVLSKTIHPSTVSKGITIVRSIDDAIIYAESLELDCLWVIGGETIYKEFIEKHREKITDCVLTSIPGKYNCDTFFPTLDSFWRQNYCFEVGTNIEKVEVKYFKNIFKPEIFNKKAAFITGITGQDGSYLAELLLLKGYDIYGIVRRTSRLYESTRLDHIRDHINLKYGDLSDTFGITAIINDIINTNKYNTLEIYNLAAQSHVGISFELPEYTSDVDGLGVLRILEIMKHFHKKSNCQLKFYQAGTSELYGKASSTEKQSLDTVFNPVSPYAVAKLYAFHMTKVYRDAYNLYAVNGVLFNHESPRRGENFVTMKVINAIKDIVDKKRDKISLGNLSSKRDWGHAKDYVRGMWLIMQQEGVPKDYLLATGETHSVKEFVEKAFAKVNMILTWKGSDLDEKGIDQNGNIRVDINPKYFRPNEVDFLLGDPSKAENELGWKREYTFDGLIDDMLSK